MKLLIIIFTIIFSLQCLAKRTLEIKCGASYNNNKITIILKVIKTRKKQTLNVLEPRPYDVSVIGKLVERTSVKTPGDTRESIIKKFQSDKGKITLFTAPSGHKWLALDKVRYECDESPFCVNSKKQHIMIESENSETITLGVRDLKYILVAKGDLANSEIVVNDAQTSIIKVDKYLTKKSSTAPVTPTIISMDPAYGRTVKYNGQKYICD